MSEDGKRDEEAKKLGRVSVPAMDAILGFKFEALDGQGHVRVIDYMGDDAAIVQAARVSYGDGTETPSSDRKLIRYLMRHWHTTPFEMVELKIHVRVPMDVWRQWIRHRMASVNEYSTRYSVAIDEAARTYAHAWRSQSKNNKQGSGDYLDEEAGDVLTEVEGDIQLRARQVYEDRLAAGVAREQARKDLPLSTFTEAYWKIDGHNLLHFLRLRLDPHAQREIREYAQVIAGIVKQWLPITYEAFEDYRRGAITLSEGEQATIEAFVEVRDDDGDPDLEDLGKQCGLDKREREELRAKLVRIGMVSLNE